MPVVPTPQGRLAGIKRVGPSYCDPHKIAYFISIFSRLVVAETDHAGKATTERGDFAADLLQM
jgi:hypothetical protein